MFGCSDNVSPHLVEQFDAAYLPEGIICDERGSSPHTPDILSNLMMTWANPTMPSTIPYAPNEPYSDQSPLPMSPQSVTPPTPTTVQATRSFLIKEGLKLTIQTRRLAQGKSHLKPEYSAPLQEEQLTLEDEDRRNRRRERNKVAATKCRNKKKERTQRLTKESETLEATNHALKEEIQELQREKQQLLDMLRNHLPICRLPAPCNACAHAQPCPVI